MPMPPPDNFNANIIETRRPNNFTTVYKISADNTLPTLKKAYGTSSVCL